MIKSCTFEIIYMYLILKKITTIKKQTTEINKVKIFRSQI